MTSSTPWGSGRTSGRFVGTITVIRSSPGRASPGSSRTVKPIGPMRSAISPAPSATPIWRRTRATGTLSVNGIGHIAADVEHPVGHPQPGHALAQHLAEPRHRRLDAPGIAPALEARRRLGAQTQPFGRAGDGHRREVGGFDQHLRRGLGDLGRGAPHDAGYPHRRVLPVADEAVLARVAEPPAAHADGPLARRPGSR